MNHFLVPISWMRMSTLDIDLTINVNAMKVTHLDLTVSNLDIVFRKKDTGIVSYFPIILSH